MPRIKTQDLLDRIAANDFGKLKLKGLQGGSFYMLLECEDGMYIHENSNGVVKEYPNVNNALLWLKRKTDLKEVTVDIEIWKDDSS